MGTAEGSDVERALATLGATPIAYRSFAAEARRADAAADGEAIGTTFPLLAAALPETASMTTSTAREAVAPEPAPVPPPPPPAPFAAPVQPAQPRWEAPPPTWSAPAEPQRAQPPPAWTAPVEPQRTPLTPAWTTPVEPPRTPLPPAWTAPPEPPRTPLPPTWTAPAEPPRAEPPRQPPPSASATRTLLTNVFRVLRGGAAPFRPAPEPVRGLHDMFRRL